MRIKIKAILNNIGENKEELIEVNGIKNKNKITYKHEDTIIKLNIDKDKLVLVRENPEFIHTFLFQLNKETISTYYIKEYNTNIEVNIITNELIITDQKIEVRYVIKESQEEYKYLINME